MNARLLILPALVLLTAAFVATPEAEAHPFGHAISGKTGVALGPRIFVGGRLGIPVGRSGGYYRDVVSYTGGHYETRTRRIQVRGQQIGWDFEGKPIYAGNRTELDTYQVWVPRRRIVRRVWVPRRHRGVITVGGRVRIR